MNFPAPAQKISIRRKLYLAIAVINVLTLTIGAVSWNAFQNSAHTIRLITEDMIPVMNSVAEITVLGSRIGTLTPRLTFVRTSAELEEVYDELTRLLDRMESTIASATHDYQAPEDEKFPQIVDGLVRVRTEMENHLQAFRKDVGLKITLLERQKQNANALGTAYGQFMVGIPPILDDAQFDLLLGLEERAKTYDTLLTQAETMVLAFQIQAEGNQLVSILEQALTIQDATRLAPQIERFDAIRDRLEDHIEVMENSRLEVGVIHAAADVFYQLGKGPEGIFNTQRVYLERIASLNHDLDELETIGSTLNEAVGFLSRHVADVVEKRKNETDRSLNFWLYTIILIAVTSIFFSILISWLYISGGLVKRLEKLRSVMLALAGKDFSQTIEGRFDGDEIGQMASALFTFREKLIENELLTRDLRYAIEESERARREADKANQSKSEFLANMSHELRTPLNSIIGLSRMLVEDLPKGEDHEMASTVHKSASSLLDIVNDILDLSKIEAQQMVLERIGFDFKVTMAAIIETLAPIASGKGVWLHYKYKTDNIPYIIGDPARLGRILTNLIGNAIKYTLDGSVQVTVDYEPVGENRIAITCRIADTGIGIAEDKQDVIFQKFSQADGSTTRKFGGTGLGLAITKELVEMMKGEIGVTSKLGEGSTFWFTIPFDTTTELQEDSRDHVVVSYGQHGVRERQPASGAKVLVAEDHQLNQVFIKKLLDRIGFKGYVVVENGQKAIDEWQTGQYSMILMDCHMPEMNGYQATEKIRSMETGKKTPIIALTADAMVGTSEKCIAAGMDDYISKPIDSKAFSTVLGKWFIFDAMPAAAPAAPTPKEKIVDFSALDDYADTDEEKQQFCQIFIERTDQALDELKNECTDGNNEKWVEITHKIKGSAAMIGAIKLAELGAQAQNMQDSTASLREAKLKALQAAYDEVKTLFEEEILK